MSRFGGGNPFSNPFRSQAAPATTEAVPPAQAAPVARVESQPLAPPQIAAPAVVAARPSPVAPLPAATVPVTTASAAAPVITGGQPPTGRSGWTWEGGTPITIGQGDNIQAISRRYGVPAQAILDANNITDAAAIQPGQRLVIPTFNAGGPATRVASPMGATRPTDTPAVAAPVTQPAVASPAAPRTVFRPTAPPVTHVVQPAETLSGIARTYNVDRATIAAANNIPVDSHVRIGQRLTIPGASAPATTASTRPAAAPVAVAPAPARPAAPAAVPAAPRVAAAPVAPAPAVAPRAAPAAAAPAAAAPAPAQRVAAAPASPAPAAAPRAATPAPAAPARTATPAPVPPQPQPAAPAAPAQRQAAVGPGGATTPATPGAPATNPARNVTPVPANPNVPPQQVRVADAGTPPDATPTPSAAGGFAWPVRGRVTQGFGPRPNGAASDGITLAVPEGTSIKAADDGVVAYAGSELRRYGNLVLVRHANGYTTAYAHNSELLVKRGDAVRRGQIIARAGQTGEVTAPQLHFEIRRGSTPVDPMPLLQ